ncbi:YfhO family protein [Mammaliicoccus sciuri]|uniref:YfhO family protein n=1 Tax=Mammaliicoccus sciuri TaxID=1296 RepID=UPI0037A6D390
MINKLKTFLNNNAIFKYILLFGVLAILGHSYILYRYFKDGIIFTGPNDGIEQMLPIQMYLYEHWTHGTFFYSTDLGLGGDMFMDLSYYFSTNILFIINVIFVWIGSFIFHFNTDHMLFWAQNAIVISIIKSFLIMSFTYLYVKKIGLNRTASIVATFLFAVSPIYFRFTVYWPFFSDVFMLLPLLLFSIERFLKDKKIGMFILIVALTFINNFYFAYYQFLTGLIYFFYRFIFQHKADIVPRMQQLKLLVVASILGLGSSLFIFFHSAHSFIGNNRAIYNGTIPLLSNFNKHDNIFYDNYLIVVLFIAIQALSTIKLYKHYYYRLFSIFTIILMIASFLPYVDSIFNGFSAPQKRWHYLLTFFSSGLIASYVYYFKSISIKQYIITAIPGFVVIFTSYYITKDYVSWIWMVPILFIIGLLVLTIKRFTRLLMLVFATLILLTSFLVSKEHSKNQIYHDDHERRANKFFIQASTFDSGLQRSHVSHLDQQLNPDERLGWRVLTQDNTPMYQHFKGLSLYSSIFDGGLNQYLFEDAKVNLQNESLSRYSDMQDRSNLYSLWSTKYIMKKSYQKSSPANFKLIQDDGKYQILENEQPLPAVKVTDQYYDAHDIDNPLDLEHAMIKGVVTTDKDKVNTEINKAPNLLNQTTITTRDADYKDDMLTVPRNGDGLTIQLPKKLTNQYQDLYLMLHLERELPQSNFTIQVNDYPNNRLFQDSKYRMNQDDLLYRVPVPKDGKIFISLTNGKYKLQLQSLYGENYQTLKQAHKEKRYTYHETNGKINISLKEHKKGTAVINIPYREGLKAKVDGKDKAIHKVNHIMTGIDVDQQDKDIEITYQPPYFKTMILVSIVSIILSIVFTRKVNSKQQT